MNTKITGFLQKIFLALILSAPLQGLERQKDVVTFNTEQVFFHEPIQELQRASAEELLHEPSMKQATVDFAWKVGGPITHAILQRFKELLSDEDYSNMRIDTKIQKISKNAYSNTPGWHCDFFSTSDEQDDKLLRINPGLETQTRLFLLISGQPATEFMLSRNIDININVPSWKEISEHIDSFVKPEDLYRIPIATPVELYGNELHRVTLYEGAAPTVRYFMRVYIFPEGHSEYGKFANALFDWETYQESDISDTLGDVEGFLSKAFAHLHESGIDVSHYEMTHLCYRVATKEEFVAKKEALSRIGTLISEVLAEGRPYLVFKLYRPITYQNHQVSLIALPFPKPNNTYATALQHVAFLTKEDLGTLPAQYPHLTFDILELNRASHPELKLRFDDLVVKFHNVSLEDLGRDS